MKTTLCKCNNCDSILIDENPQFNATEFELQGHEKHMLYINVGPKNCPEYIWACPECETDEYLTDIDDI
jgi:hypothetical protein